MERIKIMHCADLHLGAEENLLKSQSKSRRFETLLTFERAIKEAQKREVKIVLIAGDLLDSNYIEEEFVSGVLSAVRAAKDMEFVFSAGNHDPLNYSSPFLKISDMPDNFHILSTSGESIKFEDIKTCVFGRSFKEVFSSDPLFIPSDIDDDYINIMCVHGELSGTKGGNYNSVTESDIANSKADYAALGHIHKRSDILRAGNTFYAYSGSIEGHGFDETGEKGVYIGEVGKRYCNLEFVSVTLREYVYLKADISEAFDERSAAEIILNKLNCEFGLDYEKNLYKIDLTGNIGEEVRLNLDEIAVRLKEKLYFVKLRDKTETKTDLKLLSDENTLKGRFVKKMLEMIGSAGGNEKELYLTALNIGLKAFTQEVKYNEDQ